MSSSQKASVIVFSDRIFGGSREDRVGALAANLLEQAMFTPATPVIYPEGAENVSDALSTALAHGPKIIVTCGSTGVGPKDMVPDISEQFCAVRLTGLEQQILLKGLESTNKAGLSRGIVGLTSRSGDSTLIINTPCSTGGVRDSLDVVLPLVDSIFEKF